MPDLLLVSGDHGHPVEVVISDPHTGLPVNLTGTTVRLYLRRIGAATLAATITGTLPGTGTDGRARFVWPPATLDTPGDYRGEIEVSAAGLVQTVYRHVEIRVRPQLQV